MIEFNQFYNYPFINDTVREALDSTDTELISGMLSCLLEEFEEGNHSKTYEGVILEAIEIVEGYLWDMMYE